MKQIVIMPGGFHPFHAGHMALYNSAKKAFPDADVYVAATDSREERPFPFQVKEKLAKVAGVTPGRFIQVKSPFMPREITQNYNPEQDVLIFVRSEKDRNESPKPGGTKKDGSPSYFQPWTGKNVKPFNKEAYMAYLPTVTFGPGIKSATEIRNAWPGLNDRQKTAMVMSLYPAAQKNKKLATNVVAMLDQVMGEVKVNEAHPKQQISRYNPDGTTYRGEKLPIEDPNDIYNKGTKVPLSALQNVSADEPNTDSSIKDFIKNRMNLLEPKEQKILKLRFWYGMTLEEIADKVELSPNRIRQIEAHAIRKLIQPNLDVNPKEIMRMYVPESQDYLEEK